jgi:hypothetical protein
MNRFQDLETSILIEMLARHTSQLTSMLIKTVTSKEYGDCKKIIEQLQSEINLRTYPTYTEDGNAEISFGIK